MPYKPINFMGKLTGFVNSCPFLGSQAGINIMTFSPNAIMDGNALTYAGTGKPRIKTDVMGNVISSKQANFMLHIRRPTADDVFRLEVADFLYNFEAWVEYENFLGKPPRFGDTQTERIWADNGMFWEDTETPGVTDYMVQIHVEYQVTFETEEDY